VLNARKAEIASRSLSEDDRVTIADLARRGKLVADSAVRPARTSGQRPAWESLLAHE